MNADHLERTARTGLAGRTSRRRLLGATAGGAAAFASSRTMAIPATPPATPTGQPLSMTGQAVPALAVSIAR